MSRSNRIAELTKPIKAQLARFEKLETKILQHESPLIFSISQHLLRTRGKRLRPLFTFLISKATGFKSRRLVEAALAIELIHTATLLHDDVIDESEIRRGCSTVNYKWNNLISVLMGDYFFAKAFTIMVKTGSLELLRHVSMATERVSVGELRQIEEAYNFDLSEQAYMKIIADKTASLFQTSAISPPLLADAPKNEISRLAKFGEYTGCAFQITDDLLDIVGIEAKTGKKPGNDLMQGKITLPLIYSLRKSSATTRKDITRVLQNGIGKKSLETVLDYLHTNGGIDYARMKANRLADKAVTFLAPFRNHQNFKLLEKLASFSVDRDI